MCAAKVSRLEEERLGIRVLPKESKLEAVSMLRRINDERGGGEK